MINYIKTIILFFPFFFYAQNTKITILDKLDKKPLIGMQILSGNGSFIGNSNSIGEFEFDLADLRQQNIKSIMVYDSDYLPIEYKIDEIPNIVYSEKIRHYELETVVIAKKGSKEYYTVKGFFRSWQLVNGKLIKYGDGMIDYHMPYADVNNDYNTGVKSYVTSYRTFKGDSLKQRLRIIKTPPLDGYLGVSRIPKNNLLKRNRRYLVNRLKDNTGDIYIEDKKKGFVVYDENNNPSLINVSTNSEEDEVIQGPFQKVTGKWKQIEKWTGDGNVKHPTYIFYSGKIIDKTKVNGKSNIIETIHEIFIDDDIIADDLKPEIKTFINKDRSFYNTEYWKEQIKIHPLPSAIDEQLINVNENKNSY